MAIIYWKDKTQNQVPDSDVEYWKGQGWSDVNPNPEPIANVNPQQAGANANATAQSGGQPLNYMGNDVSDSALAGARKAYEPWTQPNNFLDKVKERLQTKFKPETETLGLGSFSATLGALDPSGVMAGISEKSNQFRKKGALALKALSTANDLYSEQANIALDKLNRLEGYREAYEDDQKAMESEFKDLAMNLVQQGLEVPPDIMQMLSPKYQQVIGSLSGVYKQAENDERIANASGSGDAGWFNDEINLGYGGECGVVARRVWSVIPDEYGMGDTLKTKMDWINKYGTKGNQGITVGDLIITDGSDLTGGKTLNSGHALMAGAVDQDGNIYAYEANAKGDGKITAGRWVNPSAIYGYIGKDSQWGDPKYGVMKPAEFKKMQATMMKLNRGSGAGRPEATGINQGTINITYKELTETDIKKMKANGYDPKNQSDRNEYFKEVYGEKPTDEELTDADREEGLLNALKDNNLLGSDQKVSWETYAGMKEDWIRNGGTEAKFKVLFPVSKYMDEDNQYEYENYIK
jgi:hypothetical protein